MVKRFKVQTFKRPEYDPDLAEVNRLLNGIPKAAIARSSGVSVSCLRAWNNGTTKRPQNMTLTFAMRAAGYRRPPWEKIK